MGVVGGFKPLGRVLATPPLRGEWEVNKRESVLEIPPEGVPLQASRRRLVSHYTKLLRLYQSARQPATAH